MTDEDTEQRDINCQGHSAAQQLCQGLPPPPPPRESCPESLFFSFLPNSSWGQLTVQDKLLGLDLSSFTWTSLLLDWRLGLVIPGVPCVPVLTTISPWLASLYAARENIWSLVKSEFQIDKLLFSVSMSHSFNPQLKFSCTSCIFIW